MFCSSDTSVQTMNSTQVLKKGWMQKCGGGLFKKWQRKHVSIHLDGGFLWSDEDRGIAKGSFNVKRDCTVLVVGPACGSSAPKPPSGYSVNNRIFMKAKGKSYYFVAENDQEFTQWMEALYKAKGLEIPPRPTGQPYPQQQGSPYPQQAGMPYPQQQPGMPQPPPPGFNPSVVGPPPPYQTVASPGYPQSGPHPQGYPQGVPPAQGYPGAYPAQGGYQRPANQTIIVNQQQDRGYLSGAGGGFATGLMAGYMLGSPGWGWGYGGWGYGGWGHGGGIHFHDHDHYHDHDHFGGGDNFGCGDDFGGGGDFGGGDFGGGDFGGGDCGGGDF